jgi:hypothetical protein
MPAFFHVLGAPFRALFNIEGRRAWAVMLMAGCAVTMTAYAGFALYLVRKYPNYAFYLGAGALLLVAIVVTGFASLITKRDIDVNALGMKFRVSDQQVQEIASAVVAATPPAPPPAPPPPAAVIVQTGTPSP